jgi:hypothetical protein
MLVYATSFGTARICNDSYQYLTNTLGMVAANITGYVPQVVGAGVQCNAAAIPIFQLHVPATVIFQGYPNIAGTGTTAPAGVPAVISLDLHDIQQRIMESL